MNPTGRDLTGAEFLRHAAWIRRLAIGLVGDSALAEDLVQDTWLAALRRPPSTDRPLRPWLATVARNAARQAFRGQGRRARREAEAGQPAPTVLPAELSERLELERGLTDELARLEEPLRTTLMLRYYEGLEPSEIARRQGLPAGTVRWRVKRGLERMRERLDHRFGDRAQWCVLFQPLLRPVETATATLSGVLAMHVLLKLGVGAASLVALAVALRFGGAVPDSMWPFAGEAPAPIAMRPFVPAVEADPLSDEAIVPATSTRVALRGASTEANPGEGEPVAPRGARVEARAVDELGAPIPRARLRALVNPSETFGDLDGNLRLELPREERARRVAFTLEASGFATLAIEAVATPDQTTHLGTFTLTRGGVVSGRVRDAGGQPVGEALVTFTGVDTSLAELRRMRLGRPDAGVPEGRTRADGHFTVEGVASGYVRVWAWSEGYLATFSAPVEVQAGQESYDLELVLDPIPSANRIGIVVLDPDGAPVPGALLDYRHQSEETGTTMAGDQTADSRGRFEFLVPPDAELWITARDPEGRFGPGSASAVKTASEQTLWLTRAERFELRAVDLRGDPVERFAVDVLSLDEGFSYQGEPRGERPDGRLALRLPSEPFKVRVDAPGHELSVTGPFDPAALPEVLSVVLSPLPGLHGAVLIGDDPASGASVTLHPLVGPKREHVKNGFRTELQEAVDSATCDEDGRFLLTVREPGRYAVRAEREGLAPALSAVLDLVPGLATTELELWLTTGGTIEGRVVQLDGSDPAGTIVGLSRADGFDRTVRVGPEGAYRFEHLTPGPWRLLSPAEEVQPGRTHIQTSDRSGPLPEIEWSCRVYEGQTTRFDLVLGEEGKCALQGRLTIDGKPPMAWKAVLLPVGELFAGDSGHEVGLAADGTFLLATGEPGAYQLVLRGSQGDGHGCFLLDEVRLDWGDVPWQLDLELGALRVVGAPTWDGNDFPAFVHVWNGPGRCRAFSVLAGDTNGELEARVPAGRGRIARPDPTNRDFDAWPTVLEVDVPRTGMAKASLR